MKRPCVFLIKSKLYPKMFLSIYVLLFTSKSINDAHHYKIAAQIFDELNDDFLFII